MRQKTILSKPEVVEKKYPFHISKQVKAQLDKAKSIVTTADQDRVYCITGREGLGKSTLAMQLAYYVDPKLNIKNIVFSSDDFEKRIRSMSKFRALIFDEAFNGLSSKSSLSKENKKLVQLLMECRARNLYVFIVLPSFFLLEKYVAIFRSHALFHVCTSKKRFKQRWYKVYSYNNKKKLFIFGKKLMDYAKPHIYKNHRFFRKMPPTITKEEYVAKKLGAFRGKEKLVAPESRAMTQRNTNWRRWHEMGYSYQDIADFHADDYPVTRDAVFKALQPPKPV